MDSKNVRMAQCGDRPRFLLKTPQAIFVFCQRLWQCFDRDLTTEPRIPRAVHFPHAACADRRNDFVRTKFRARDQSHPWAQL